MASRVPWIKAVRVLKNCQKVNQERVRAHTHVYADVYLKSLMITVCLPVGDGGKKECRERVGGVSIKNSPMVVLTPDASSHCESFCPPRLVSSLLLVMLLLLRRFGMQKRERETE